MALRTHKWYFISANVPPSGAQDAVWMSSNFTAELKQDFIAFLKSDGHSDADIEDTLSRDLTISFDSRLGRSRSFAAINNPPDEGMMGGTTYFFERKVSGSFLALTAVGIGLATVIHYKFIKKG